MYFVRKFCELALYFRLWGVNCGSAVEWNGSWRLMYIERPHLLFVGIELILVMTVDLTLCIDLSFLLLIYMLTTGGC